MQIDRKLQRNEIKKKLLIDQQRLHASDESEEDVLDNRMLQGKAGREAIKAGLDMESSGESDDSENEGKAKSNTGFVNPLAKKN